MIYNRLKNLRFFRTLLTLFNNISLHRKIVLTYFFFIFMLVGILAASIYTFTASTIRTQSTFSLQQSFNQASSYLTYKLNEKLKEKGEALELDENDNIKGWNNQLEGLKTQFPNMFGSGDGGNGYKPLDPNKLPNNNYDKTVTKEQFAKMTYEERVKLKQANEERYKQLAGK